MKMSNLFGQTLRDSPAEAEVASHSLLMRAGFIRPLGAGIFSYLHLAKRSISKIEGILRDEMNAISGQEISMPVVHPAEIWKETGRWYQIGSEMARFQDKNNHDMVLAMTHEEVVADLVRREIQSYKQLPRLVYHIQTKWRDDPRPRAGLIRVREFTMKDSYSLDSDWDGLDEQYRAHYRAYFNIFQRCGLPVIAVKSDTGMMGGKMAHEFMYLTPIGEDSLILCDTCGYTANRQVAIFKKALMPTEGMKEMEKVFTPNCRSIDELSQFLRVPKSMTAKAVFYMAKIPQGHIGTETFIFAVIRGDMDLNETKLANAVGARELRPATEDEIIAIGAEPGFASPIGIKRNKKKRFLVVLDDSIPASPNLVAGANEKGYHLRNTNQPRDYPADIIADITAADSGLPCSNCSNPLRMARGVEVGNIFKLGTRYSDALGCTFLDRDGIQKPVVMGSYGIGVGRLLACLVEEHHDEKGLVWPLAVAPYQVYLIALPRKEKPNIKETAGNLYQEMQASGVEVLFDDRDESPGIKFNDADLIGLPVRITVSERALNQGGVEQKLRRSPDKVIIPLDSAITEIKSSLTSLRKEAETLVKPVEYNEKSSLYNCKFYFT